MVWRNYNTENPSSKKEAAGYVGMLVLSSAIAVIDSVTKGDLVSFAGAGGIAMLSAWGLMNLRRDKPESAFDEKD
ncbi:MAG: hypothetical protein KGH71_05340 [Candidatus Micrarchaeota archaeon]|nr:hypothetical protein [Candidatus Micrarchaeota archaeon]